MALQMALPIDLPLTRKSTTSPSIHVNCALESVVPVVELLRYSKPATLLSMKVEVIVGLPLPLPPLSLPQEASRVREITGIVINHFNLKLLIKVESIICKIKKMMSKDFLAGER